MMPFYHRELVLVEAIQLRWATWNEICAFLGDTINDSNPGFFGPASDTCGECGPDYINIKIPTPIGEQIVQHRDYVIQGVNGEFYACKPDVFAEIYEKVGS
jgi:hypothetical protein